MKQEVGGRAAYLGGDCFWLHHCSLGLVATWHGHLLEGRAMLQHNWLQDKNLGGVVKNFKVWTFASVLLGTALGLFLGLFFFKLCKSNGLC